VGAVLKTKKERLQNDCIVKILGHQLTTQIGAWCHL